MLFYKKISCTVILLLIIFICTACEASTNESFYEKAVSSTIPEANTSVSVSDISNGNRNHMNNENIDDGYTGSKDINAPNVNQATYQGMLSQPNTLQLKNTYETLNVATYLTKIEDMYFIVDCYHNQILYHNSLGVPLTEWQVLTNEVHYAHTIAADDKVMLVDDTENNRVLVFQKVDGRYAHTQTLDHIGLKPHYIQYDAPQKVFMIWSSITGEMFFIKRETIADDKGIFPLYIEKVLKIDELYGVYVRSFTIMEDGVYFVSGHNNQKIIKAELSADGETFEIKDSYAVSDEIAGMVQLTKIEDYFYITISTDNQENQDYATIVRCKTLEELERGDYEDVYGSFGVSGGTPYYITEIEGRYYMAHHRTNENIIAFDVENNKICNVETIY